MFSHSFRYLTRLSTTSSVRRIALQACERPRNVHLHDVQNRFQRRVSTQPALHVNQQSPITMEEYHVKADHAMDALLDTLENLLDSRGQSDWQVDYHSGVLTLELGSNGTYVINKQPPNKQIWLSSPRSGPKRYDFQEAGMAWVYSRDGKSIDALLSEELSNVFNVPIKITMSQEVRTDY